MTEAIYAGSFDPLTNGHMEVIRKALMLFDKLVIVIAVNPSKPNGYFTPEERKTLVEKSLRGYCERVEVQVVSDRFVVDYAYDRNIRFMVRGLRNTMDYHAEVGIYEVNKRIRSGIETIFVMSQLGDVSSSAVKSLVGFKDWYIHVAEMVPPAVFEAILEKTSRFPKKEGQA